MRSLLQKHRLPGTPGKFTLICAVMCFVFKCDIRLVMDVYKLTQFAFPIAI